MSNYGKIDILWYDVAWPLKSPKLWESAKMNAMVREHQPHILINNRSQLGEDFGTAEENITPEPEEDGRGWEACVPHNETWGYMPCSINWRPNHEVIGMLARCSAYNGNLLLNVGPKPDGSLPEEAVKRLTAIGKWTQTHGEAIYGKMQRVDSPGVCVEGMPISYWPGRSGWSLKDKNAYFWCRLWPGEQIVIGGIRTKINRITNLTTGQQVAFTQSREQLVMTGLPETCPDPIAGISIFKLELAGKMKQVLRHGCVILPKGTAIERAHPWLRWW
jgi:alpha-L-fucosidase